MVVLMGQDQSNLQPWLMFSLLLRIIPIRLLYLVSFELRDFLHWPMTTRTTPATLWALAIFPLFFVVVVCLSVFSGSSFLAQEKFPHMQHDQWVWAENSRWTLCCPPLSSLLIFSSSGFCFLFVFFFVLLFFYLRCCSFQLWKFHLGLYFF